MNLSIQILCLLVILMLVFLLLFFVGKKLRKKKKQSIDKFNAQQTNLDRTDTYYQEFDTPNEMAYVAPEARLNPASLQTLSKWYMNEARIMADIKKYSQLKFLQKDLDNILKINEMSFNQLRQSVYNNKDILVKDSHQVCLCLFVTFGFYEQDWKVSSVKFKEEQLNILVLKLKDKNKKKTTFIKCERV